MLAYSTFYSPQGFCFFFLFVFFSSHSGPVPKFDNETKRTDKKVENAVI